MVIGSAGGTFSVIYNPIATKFSEEKLQMLISGMERKGLELYRCVPSEYSGHVIPLVKELDADSDYIITFGGDGTANEAVRAFNEIEQHSVYGHISAGTTNDMAANLGLFRKDEGKSIETLISEGVETEIDSIIVNGEPVCYVSAFGYVAPIPYLTDVQLKKQFGHAAYVMTALPLVARKPEDIRLRYTAGGEVRDITAHMCLVTSSKGMGGVTLYPNADLNDGKFEVFFLKDFSPSIVPRLFSEYVRDSLDLKELTEIADVFSTDELTIEFTGDLPENEVDNDGNRASFTYEGSGRVLRYSLGKKIKVLRVM